jgi:hypothetical protein
VASSITEFFKDFPGVPVTDQQDDYKYNENLYKGSYTSQIPPSPVGYWILDPYGLCHTKIGMYSKPTEAQIKYTEEMLGWKWEDVSSAK